MTIARVTASDEKALTALRHEDEMAATMLNLDRDDWESLFWAGWIELERGLLGEAEHRFRHILGMAIGDDRARHLAWCGSDLAISARNAGI